MDEQLVQRMASIPLPTSYGEFTMTVYNGAGGKEHVALTAGAVADGEPVLVRLHSECLTGDVFGSQRCDCGEQLQDSMRALQCAGRGVLLYMRQEGRGIGLTNKVRAYALQDRGYDTAEANLALGFPVDSRDYSAAAAMLLDLGVSRIYLMTNNPAKIEGLARRGVLVLDQVPLTVPANPHNQGYLRTKQQKMGHLLAASLPTTGGAAAPAAYHIPCPEAAGGA